MKTKTSLRATIKDFFLENYAEELQEVINSTPANDPKTHYKTVVIDFQDFKDSLYQYANRMEKDNCLNILELITGVVNNDVKAELMDKDNPKNLVITPRFKNLTEITPLGDLYSYHLGRLVETTGLVKITEPARPQLYNACFECKGCAKTYYITQRSNELTYPAMCSECGSNQFKLNYDESEYIDTRTITVQENLEDIIDGNPRELKAQLTLDLAKNINAGNKISLTGVLDAKQPKGKNNKTSEFYLKANNIEVINQNLSNLDITDADEDLIIEYSEKDNLIDILVNSYAPNLKMDKEIKLGCLCSIVGAGDTLENHRDTIHILIITDPGMGKTQLKKATLNVAPRVVDSDGSQSSGVGLTASVIKDGDKWSLVAGALPLANNGLAFIDEFDKLSKDNQKQLLTPMEHSEIKINKAGFNATLKANTGVFCLGNPIYGRFDMLKPMKDQLNIYPALYSRFDLIFVMNDRADSERDNIIANALINSYTGADNDLGVEKMPQELFVKYVHYAMEKYNPVLIDNDNVKEFLTDYYVQARETQEGYAPGLDPRDLETIIRLAGAIAKLKLKNTIDLDDITNAIKLKEYSLGQVGIDPDTGLIDKDRATGKKDHNDRDARKRLYEAIQVLIDDNIDGENYIGKAELRKYAEDFLDIKKSSFYVRFDELINAGLIMEKNKLVYLTDSIT